MATSLAALRAEPLDEGISSRLMAAILRRFESVLERLAMGEPSLSQEWNRLDLLRDKWVRVDRGTHLIAGRGQGIDQEGASCWMMASSNSASSAGKFFATSRH